MKDGYDDNNLNVWVQILGKIAFECILQLCHKHYKFIDRILCEVYIQTNKTMKHK